MISLSRGKLIQTEPPSETSFHWNAARRAPPSRLAHYLTDLLVQLAREVPLEAVRDLLQ
jgi:hypothetical protein